MQPTEGRWGSRSFAAVVHATESFTTNEVFSLFKAPVAIFQSTTRILRVFDLLVVLHVFVLTIRLHGGQVNSAELETSAEVDFYPYIPAKSLTFLASIFCSSEWLQ
jgi:hypothetical protein